MGFTVTWILVSSKDLIISKTKVIILKPAFFCEYSTNIAESINFAPRELVKTLMYRIITKMLLGEKWPC